MSLTIVTTGVHNAGKSTIIQLLAQEKGIVVFSELGGELRAKTGCTSWQSCDIFDELVMLKEFERDKEIMSCLVNHTILLEQWHIGNIAHSIIRTPSVAKEYKARFSEYLSEWPSNLLVVHINLPMEQVLLRESGFLSNEDAIKMVSFYSQLNSETQELLNEWNLDVITIDGNLPKEVIYLKVRDRIISQVGKR